MADRQEVIELINQATKILVIQGENPDGDSLASALALEEILGSAGKSVSMFCAVAIPKHLRFLDGWDRVGDEFPNGFDLSIVVDTSSEALLEKTLTPERSPILRSRPMIVMDHHIIENTLPIPSTDYVDQTASSTGELLHNLFSESEFDISVQAMSYMTTSIMYDTRGLTTETTQANTIRLIADFVEAGVSLAELDENRMAMNRRDEDVAKYKGELLQRVEVDYDIGLATVDITWEEIEQYSDRYNPAVLVLDEMRLINGVQIAIAYKTYPDGKILAKIRSNRASAICSELAEHFGGGGHPHAAGFKLRGRDFEEVKGEVKDVISRLEKPS